VQLCSLLQQVNKKRALARFEPIPKECLRLFRRYLKPFGEEEARETA